MIAYNKTSLFNLTVVREMKQWFSQGMIRDEQFSKITEAYSSSLYSPNVAIRILLFMASLMALLTGAGLFSLSFDFSEDATGIALVFYASVSFIFLEVLFIKNNKHYKTGVTEAVLYHSIGCTIFTIEMLSDSVYTSLIVALLLFSFSSIRYLDLVSTVGALVCTGWLLFITLYDCGGVFQQVIPFVFILKFLAIYFLVVIVEKKFDLYFWKHVILMTKVFCLLAIYLAGNYFVVQNLNESMLGIEGPISFSWLFYSLTVLIPVIYLYIGVRYKSIVLLRISLAAIAFSAFTFKYYFSFGHPEITLTIAGAAVLGITLLILNYLKTMKRGYTRENIFSEKWSNLNVEAFVISQTMGGNTVEVQDQDLGGGGSFGGGGASDSF
jgi:hypothetical protein